MDFTELRERAVAVLFPCRCVLCGAATAYDDMWCEKCEVKKAGDVNAFEIPAPAAGAAGVFAYEGNVRNAVLRIKRTPDTRTIKFFAGMMHEKTKLIWPGITFDALVPVPASAASLSERGFNHAERLALELGALMNVPVFGDVLSRSGDSLSQHKLGSRERLLNARKSYNISNGGRIKNMTVLIIDDVFTTGATLRACAERLSGAGAKAVYGLTAAKTELTDKTRK